MVDAATAIRVGKLLGADVLAVVETDPQSSQALGILAFETASGMHLCDTALAEDDPEQAARQIAQAVRVAVRKRALGPGARRTFCLVSVRNADLPLSANPLCDGVGRLVERALSQFARYRGPGAEAVRADQAGGGPAATRRGNCGNETARCGAGGGNRGPPRQRRGDLGQPPR